MHKPSYGVRPLVCLSVRPFVRHVCVFCRNEQTHFFTAR